MKKRINLTLLINIICLLGSCNKNEKFDSDKWKQGGGENILTEMRMNMVNDIIESEILLGKTKADVDEILGNSERVNSFSKTNVKLYPVMEKYKWNIDPDELIYLEVQFDILGIAKNVKTYKTK